MKYCIECKKKLGFIAYHIQRFEIGREYLENGWVHEKLLVEESYCPECYEFKYGKISAKLEGK